MTESAHTLVCEQLERSSARVETNNDDDDLVERTRAGDNQAFDMLYRRYFPLAQSYARSMLYSHQDAEDAAADAFTNILAALQNQSGPREQFRPYLLACVRNGCARKQRQRAGEASVRPEAIQDTERPAAERIVECAFAATAFASLAERWRSVLWMSEVESLDATTIAEHIGVNAPAAAAILHRAREGFAEAYLSQHLDRSPNPGCARFARKITRYVRGTAGSMTRLQVESHIQTCGTCARAARELSDVNSSLRSLGWPALIAAAGAGDVMATGAGVSGVVTAATAGWFVKAGLLAAAIVLPLAAQNVMSDPVMPASAASASPSRLSLDTANTAPPVRRGIMPSTAIPLGTTPTRVDGDAGAGNEPDPAAHDTPGAGGKAGAPSIATVDIFGSTASAVATSGLSVPTLTLPAVAPPPVSLPPVGLSATDLLTESLSSVSVAAGSLTSDSLLPATVPAVTSASLPPISLPVPIPVTDLMSPTTASSVPVPADVSTATSTSSTSPSNCISLSDTLLVCA